jgi:hypothetical protein
MLINARDPRQWTYLRNLPKKKKKKNSNINQCGEKGGGGYYIPVGSMYLKNSEPLVPGIISRINMGMEEHTCLHNEPARKGWKKKKTLILTLGSPPEKDGKQKKPWY